MSIALAPIQRDDGRWYRPRKIICAPVHDELAEVCGVIVFGTHDVAACEPFALESARYWTGATAVVRVPVTGWWRDTIARGERTYAVDASRGRAGVWFDVIDSLDLDPS